MNNIIITDCVVFSYTQGCQVQGNEKFGLGSLKSTTYDLSGEEGKWKLTATYKDGQDSRQMVVTFQYTKGADIKLKYDEENPPKHYVRLNSYDVLYAICLCTCIYVHP